MMQKVMIEVESDVPLHKLNDGHILVYDLTKRKYYATTRASFLREQDLKISKIEENYKQLEERFENFSKQIDEWQDELVRRIKTNESNFTSKMETERNDFLKTYQETNAKMIDMIEAHIIK